MGNLTSSSNFNDLVLNALGSDGQKAALKAEKTNALLEQKNNVKTLKKKLGTYRAQMASQGIGASNGGVELGLIEDAEDENKSIVDSFNQKLKSKARANRQKALLAAGDFVKKASFVSS